MRGWTKTIVDTVAIVLIILAAKTAIAEPYYVPSGSMEPTLQIGDELLATKYPYGYSAASLPPFITLPDTQRESVLGQVRRLLAGHPALAGGDEIAIRMVTRCTRADLPS